MDLTVNGLYLSEAILQEFSLGGNDQDQPQVKALNQFLLTAKEPWDKNLYQWRLDRLKDQISMAGEPGAGNGAPVDSKGNYIQVLPNSEWLKKNTSLIKEIPNDCLPPEMRKPNMMDKVKGVFGINENTDPQLGDIGDLDQNDIANIQDPNAFEWQAVRNQIIDAKQKGVPAEEIAKLQAQYDQLAGDKADAWEKTYAKVQAQKEKDQNTYGGGVRYLDPKDPVNTISNATSSAPADATNTVNESLDRIKSLTSRVLRG